jgi:hypothetical protein
MPDDSPMTECPQGDSKPSADPTQLTTEALQRAINSLHDIISREVTHECESRVAADLAIQAFNKRELQLIEGQRVEQKLDTKAAVDAALAAAKEAVKEQTTASGLSISKSENATNEQLKQLGATFTTAIAGVDRTINDWKDRVTSAERALATHSAQQGGEATGTDKMMPWVWAILASVVAVVSIIIQLAR